MLTAVLNIIKRLFTWSIRNLTDPTRLNYEAKCTLTEASRSIIDPNEQNRDCTVSSNKFISPLSLAFNTDNIDMWIILNLLKVRNIKTISFKS